MARTPRPTVTSLVYGLFDGGYRVIVTVNGAVRAAGKAVDRVEGKAMARRITRVLKRQMRANSAVIPAVIVSTSGDIYTITGVASSR